MSCYGSTLEIKLLFSAFSGLSSLFSIAVIIICIIGKILDDFSSRIVVYMSFNDIIRSIALVTSVFISQHDEICAFLGYIVIFTFISNVVWTLSISLTLYQVIILQNPNYESHHKYWVIFSCPILALIESGPFLTNSYGSNGSICTLKNDSVSNTWRIIIIYIPYWIVSSIILIAFFKIYSRLKVDHIEKPAYNLIMSRGYIYPLVMIFIIVVMTVLRIFQMTTNWCEIDRLATVIEYLLSVHGLLNAVAFLLNTNIRKVLRKKICMKNRNSSEYFYSIGDELSMPQA